MNKFADIRDPLFLVCVAIYGFNRCAEHFGFDHWLLRGYLNDLICIAFWIPIVIFALRRLGLRDDAIPRNHEIVIAFLIWSVMFEIWLPNTSMFAPLTTADPWDIVCYAVGGVFAGSWWNKYYGQTPEASRSLSLNPQSD